MSTIVSYKGSTIATVNNNTKTLTTSGKYLEADVILTDSSTTTLQNKSVSPTESQQTINADSGYDGLGTVTVGAISSSYVGSGITQRSSTDLSASGDTVTVPSGYYENDATKAVASGTAGTPTASKGIVSNNSVTVTPSVTNTTGFITGSTISGTAVTVSASELDSGTKSITANGTGIDVVGYASVDVNVSGSGQQTKIIIPEQTITTSSTYTQITLFTEGFVIGEEYIYTINGTTLTATCRDFYGSNMVGNTSTNTFFEYASNTSAMYFTVNDSSLYGTYTIKVEQAIDTNGYARTIVIPQQTVTPTSDGTYYQASLLMDDVLEEGSDYIITYNGTEYFFTCVVLWGTNYLLGDANYFFGSTGHPYPFGIIWESGSTCGLAVDSDASRTIKVEKIELGSSDGEIVTVTIMDSTVTATEVESSGYMTWIKKEYIDLISESLVDNTNYIVTIDGTSYLCHAKDIYSEGDIYCGDVAVVWGTPANAIYPFAIGSYSSGNIQWMIGDNQAHAVKIKRVVSVGSPTNLITKTITQNGTYDAEDDSADGYSSVTINVPTGSSKNIQYNMGRYEVSSTSYTATSLSITVSKAGTYKCYWVMDRNTTSGTSGSQLYKNDGAVGSAHTTWTYNGNNRNGMNCEETLTLAADDVLVVRARSRNTSYVCGVLNLIIIEQ